MKRVHAHVALPDPAARVAEGEALNHGLRQDDPASHAEEAIACGCARSNRVWRVEPTGIRRAIFRRLGALPTFSEETR